MAAIEEVVSKTFDYVIVGGGTAGLALAVRLSADNSTSVIVLEAGVAHDDNDPVIAVPGQFGAVFGMPKYTYNFITVPQSHANGNQLPWCRGKGLGGSSLVNFQFWVTPPSQHVDAIEALGNPGWGWNDYAKYQARVFTQVKTAPPRYSEALDRMFLDTMANLGIEENLDLYNDAGKTVGSSLILSNLDPKTWKRSTSAVAYYNPVKDRSNLTVITEATVTRILFDSSAGVDLIAIGAEFIHDGKKYIAKSNKEIILSAGTIRSPQLLELSGIGRRDVLDKIGVDLKVELPGVGENVQEHIVFGVLYEAVPEKSFETLESLQNIYFLKGRQQSFAEGRGTPSIHPRRLMYLPLSIINPEGTADVIKKVEQEVEALRKSGTLPPGLADQYDVQLDILRNPDVPDCQVVLYPGYWPSKVPLEAGKAYVSLLYVGNHLFSRGSIHAKSSDPNEDPEIDPRYYSVDYDLQLMKQHMAFGRKIVAQEPFKSAILKQLSPEAGTSDADHVKDATGTAWHTVGSCSMMPREKNGVVSPELVVYGTKNLRVVDISVIPLHLATHTQTVAYTVAEKAADLILGL